MLDLSHILKDNEFLIVQFGIKGYHYHFMTDKGLLQIAHCPRTRTLPTKILAKVSTGNNKSCRGYKIDGKFKSLTSIEKRYYPLTKVLIQKESLPF